MYSPVAGSPRVGGREELTAALMGKSEPHHPVGSICGLSPLSRKSLFMR